MKKRHAVVGAALVAAFLAGPAVSPAHASVGQCPSGHGCMWHAVDYGGSFISDADWVKLGLLYNNQASAVKSNGNQNCARFWDNTDFTGAYIYFSRPALGGTYQDPDLRNGGGRGTYAGQNWNDRIGSQNWQKC